MTSRLRNSSAWVSADGATTRAVRPSDVTSRPSLVCGSERFRITGTRLTSSGLSSSTARLMSGPRPAKALPNSVRLLCDAARVLSSKVPMTWSISTGSGRALRSGTVAPSSKPRLEVPLEISTYLSPSADRGRMSTVESTGSGLTVVSSLSVSCALTAPVFLSVTGVMSVTAPTRVPPMRTSLPLTRLAASGTRVLSS